MSVLDHLYNIALSGALTGIALYGEHLVKSRLGVKCVRPSAEPNLANGHIGAVALELRTALEDFLRTTTTETVGREGDGFDIDALVEAEVLRHAGVQMQEVFTREEPQPQEYRFVINMTSACQDGMVIVQPYVTLLVKALSQAIQGLGHEVAINSIGKNFVVVKRFQDPLDYRAIDNVRVDSVLNLNQGMEAAYVIANMDSVFPTIMFNVVNGFSRVNDPRYKNSADVSPELKVYMYQIGRKDAKDSLQPTFAKPRWMDGLPRSYANAYTVDSITKLHQSFAQFLHNAKQYR